ncbi:MAG: 50S ribosomal protein L24e [Candidatus Methanomethylophilus sp.]|nr:50S ribosomal protein L24e [Methanomethylophilus sp.]MDD4668924.1 50S ribosomal protein L24e [Methanomethylophilus sp.]
MVEEKKCSFCGKVLEPGTGQMFVRRDGSVLYFDSSKCYKNMVELKRIPRTTAWTAKAQEEKEAHRKSLSKTADVVPATPAPAAETPKE